MPSWSSGGATASVFVSAALKRRDDSKQAYLHVHSVTRTVSAWKTQLRTLDEWLAAARNPSCLKPLLFMIRVS